MSDVYCNAEHQVCVPSWVHRAGQASGADERVAALRALAYYYGMRTCFARQRCHHVHGNEAGTTERTAVEVGIRASVGSDVVGCGIDCASITGDTGEWPMEGSCGGNVCVSTHGCHGFECSGCGVGNSVCKTSVGGGDYRCRRCCEFGNIARDATCSKFGRQGCGQRSIEAPAAETSDERSVVSGSGVCNGERGDLNESRFVGDNVIEERDVVVVSEKTLANRQKRAKKKERKLRKQSVDTDRHVPEWRRGANPNGYRGAFVDCSVEVRRELAETRAQRLIAENKASVRRAELEVSNWGHIEKAKRKQTSLRLVKAEQELELVRSRDIEQLKRRHQTRVMRDTEVNKVDVEKAHNSLIVTGNVPGFAETMLGSGSISPDSSVSAAEVRKLHKENLDQKKQIADLVERLRGCKVGVNNDVDYSVGITVDEEGRPIGDFGDGYGGYIGTDGRMHTGINWAEYY